MTTTHRAQLELGPPVRGGELRWLSASAITLGDPSQVGGCPRRWHYKYVANRAEPSTAQMGAGQEMHSEIERYLLQGTRIENPRLLVGAQFIPTPGSGMRVEQSIADGRLTAAGVPVAGHVDLFQWRGHYLSSEGVQAPEDSVEVVDWKTTSNIAKWAKTGSGLVATVQMPLYGEWAARRQGVMKWIRLSHVYFQTQGRPEARKVTIRISREELARRWEQIEGTARSLVQIARVKSERSAEVDAGPASSCTAYGGCPHRAYCPGPPERDLYALLGGNGSMSLLKGLQKTTEIEAEKARLAAAETQPDPFKEAVAGIKRKGKGFPGLAGDAAQAYARAQGIEVTAGAGLAGSGWLGGMTLRDPAELIQLAGELAEMPDEMPDEKPAPVAPAAVGLLPPDAPVSKPELAAQAVEGFVAPTTEPKRRGPGRPKKSDSPIANRETLSEIQIFVDCLPTMQFESLDGYVDALCATLAEEYGTPDVRCAPKGTPLEFGQWKGVVAALARAKPPAPGVYMLMTRSEIAGIVADALREYVAAWGMSR